MRALVIDDDDGIRWILDRVLKEEAVEVVQAGTIAEAEEALADGAFDIAFLDVYLPDGNGMDLLATGVFTMPVVMLTAETTFGHAAEAYRIGAMEYLPKPFDINEVRQLVQRVRPKKKTRKVEDKPAINVQHDMIIGRSQAMQNLFRTLGRVAASDLTVLITGESGTGKEMVARTLHERSQRAKKPFVAINTAAIPAELLESELFGHEKGSFTGADKTREGRFEQADGGTLFLDEIGDMPAALQAKLLRVLEEGRVQRVGGSSSKVVNVRLLAATHQHLPEKISRGEFREDLYYRLNVIPVHIPPLRERRDDIMELANFLLDQAVEELGMDAPILLDDAADLLTRHDWPGNVRELKNVMRRLAVLTPGASITLSDVALALGNVDNMKRGEETLSEAVTRCTRNYMHQLGYAKPVNMYQHMLEQVEPPLLLLAMERCNGNQLKVADMLGLNRNTVRKLLRKYNIDPTYFR
ncbi:two-component system, NtrC family, nitrogen regulation response regulator GlnG [Mariprofundus ferrinatatus]|uniref:DNA-binding transcriptional regulator NtrC n=1 Tax=Mariprofundus ferrinatatus TaxID=1921087 RepID=A0A2K8L124_9PROT|nr:sigma-54 dependent transcriptional regulator [Mariprofundus ferrinatatus]ATX81015.1 two-component system, NtrC family, nitrogen regulation response regulator GlnG [Mariprofundus ferrinatatus]